MCTSTSINLYRKAYNNAITSYILVPQLPAHQPQEWKDFNKTVSQRRAAMKKPNLRIHTQIDDNFQIQSGENTIIENSTDDGQNTLENFQYGYVASKEDGRTNMNQQVLIED